MTEKILQNKKHGMTALFLTILGIIAANGIPEAIVAVIIGTTISLVLLKLVPQKLN